MQRAVSELHDPSYTAFSSAAIPVPPGLSLAVTASRTVVPVPTAAVAVRGAPTGRCSAASRWPRPPRGPGLPRPSARLPRALVQ